MKRNAAGYEKETFGLDASSKDDAKKIKQAQEIFARLFAAQENVADDQTKKLDELNRHLVQLQDYKPSPPP